MVAKINSVTVTTMLVFLCAATIVPISADEFWKAFRSQEDAFNSLMAIFSLSGEQRTKNICPQFSTIQKMDTSDQIHLLQVKSDIGNKPLIPAFECIPYDEKIGNFYLTYSPKTSKFYKLELIDENTAMNYPNSTSDATDKPKEIPESKITKKDYQEKIGNYFFTHEYVAHAVTVLSSLTEGDEWSKLCAKFAPEFSVKKYLPESSSPVEIETKIFKECIEIKMPAVSCALVIEEELRSPSFYVAHFKDNIFMKISNYQDVQNEIAIRVTHDLAIYP